MFFEMVMGWFKKAEQELESPSVCREIVLTSPIRTGVLVTPIRTGGICDS